jgi:hypothetical protein
MQELSLKSGLNGITTTPPVLKEALHDSSTIKIDVFGQVGEKLHK